MLRTLMVSLPCPCMERSNVGEGGVATGAESSDDISDDMLSREPRSAPRREKYLRPRADFGGVGKTSSGDPDAAGCTWKLGVEVDERTGEWGILAEGTEINGPRVRPRPFDRVAVAAAGTGRAACSVLVTVADNGPGPDSAFSPSSPIEGISNDVSSESLCSSHAASCSRAARSPTPRVAGGSAVTAPRCLKFRFDRTTPPSVPVLKLEELGREMTVLVLEVLLCLESGRLSVSPRCTTALKLRRPASVAGGSDIAAESSRSPIIELTGVLEGKATLDAEVESRGGLVFVLLTCEALEVVSPFNFSVGSTLLNDN